MYFHKSPILRIAAVYLALFGTAHLSFSQGIPDNRFGFVGDGGLPLAQKFGLEYYTLEGNHCKLNASRTCEGNPALSATLPSSLNPANDPPQNPIAHKVVREVAKLNVRNDALGENQDYLATKLKRFTERRMNYYSRFQIGKKPTFSWYSPNAQSLINSEAPQIRATIQRENAALPAITGTIWEIGNEPNFYPSITPAQYAGIYNQYRTVIKNESSTAQIALGALFVNELVLPSLRNQATEIIFARGADEFDKRNGPVKLIALVALTTAAGAGIGAAIGSAGGPLGALIGFGVGALIGVHVTRATNRAIRDARSLVVNRLFGKSTTTYFRELVSAIPTTSAPDFISLHAYPFDDKQPFYTPQQINQILNGVSIELQDIAQARFGVRPPVLVTEFGNINFNKAYPSDVAAMADGMISNFKAHSPGVYGKWFWYKGIGQDEQFTVFSGEGINPPMTRLISDVDARPTDGNFSCNELNAIGERYYFRARGTPCVDPPGTVFPALPKITRDNTPGVIFESQRKAGDFSEIGRYLRIDYTIPTNQSNFNGILKVSAIEQSETVLLQTPLVMPNENRVQYQVLELPESILSGLNDPNRSITIVVKVLGQGKIYVTDINLSLEYPLVADNEALPVTGDPINILTFSEEATLEDFGFESVKSWQLDSLNGNKFIKSNDLGDQDVAVLQETFRTEADASLNGGYTAQFDLKYPGSPGSSNVNPTNLVSMTLKDTLGTPALELQFRPIQTGTSGGNLYLINHKTSTSIVSSPAVATAFGAAGNGGWNNIRMKVKPIASGGFKIEVVYGLNGIFTLAPIISTTVTSLPIMESMSLKHQTGLAGSHLVALVDNIGVRYNQGAPALITNGNTQNLLTPMKVIGDVFFSEKTHFNSGASGSEFIGDVVILENGSGQTFSTDAQLIFRQSLFSASKFKAQNAGLTLAGNAGFGSQLDLPLGISGKSGLLFNGAITGNGILALNNTPVLHSGSASPTRISGYSQMTNVGSALPIADRLYLRRSTLPSFNLDFSAVPASKIIAASSLGLNNIKGKDLDTYYRGLSQNALYNGYLVIRVDQPLNFQWDSANPSNNLFLGKVIFIVDSQLNVNGQFYTSMGRSRTVIAVRSNGVVNGMASPGRFQGYIHVKDFGSIAYQPGSESEFIGAIHHTGVATGMQINGSGPLVLFFDQAVIADLERIGVLSSTY